ncbi:MAG: hypothetical protein H6747_13965 [Deltaproteobacteria bacterium]|nr:hypothetical protein [Deltaproteobacteria bacterium]
MPTSAAPSPALRRLLTFSLVALTLALLPRLSHAEDNASWIALVRQLGAGRAPVVAPTWGSGSVALSAESGALVAAISAPLVVGQPGAVDVALMSASHVRTVQVDGAAAAWRLEGGVLLLHRPEGSDRSVRVRIELELPAVAGRALVVPLPAWPGGTLDAVPGDLEVQGASDDGRIAGTSRALVLTPSASKAPQVRAARYEVALRPGAADITLRIEVSGRGQSGRISLAPIAAALIDLQVDGKPATPFSEDEHHEVEIAATGRHIVIARMQVTAEGDEQDQSVSIGRVDAPITEVLVRVAGKRAIRFEPEVPTQSRFERGQTVVHGFLPPGETLQVGFAVDGDAIERSVRFSAETVQIVRMEEGLLRGEAQVQLKVVQGKATAIQLALPDEVVVAEVQGSDVSTWDVLAASGELPRRLRVGLAGDGSERRLTIRFQRPLPTKEKVAFEAPLLRPLGAFHESGVVVLQGGDKVGFADIEGAEGWLRAGLEALPAAMRQQLEGRADQVWRHIGPPKKLPAQVSAARVREVRLEARGTALVRVDERALHASHVVVVEIKAGRTDTILLDLPEAVGEPRVAAASLSKTAPAEGLQPEKGRKLWELRFSTTLEGAVQLQIDLEQLLAADQDAIVVPDVRVRGAEVETGVLALAAEAGLELAPDAQGETRPVPTTELPEALARQAGRDLVAGFRSPRGAIQVRAGLQRRATVATLDAFARRVWLDTHVLEDGRIAARAVVAVQSAGRPVLRVQLPDGAKVLALSVGDAHVKAVRDEKGGLAIPLGGGSEVRVEVRYELQRDALGALAHVELLAPRFDVRQGPLQWRVLLPGELQRLRETTDLRDAMHGDWEPLPEGGAANLMPLPLPYDAVEFRLGREVTDADGAATISMWLAPRPPQSLGWLALLAGAALLAFGALRGQRGMLIGGIFSLALGLGIGAMADAMAGQVAVLILLAFAGGVIWLLRKLRRRPEISPV